MASVSQNIQSKGRGKKCHKFLADGKILFGSPLLKSKKKNL